MVINVPHVPVPHVPTSHTWCPQVPNQTRASQCPRPVPVLYTAIVLMDFSSYLLYRHVHFAITLCKITVDINGS